MKAAWIAVFAIVLVWSGIGPKDYLTWALEVSPAVIGFVVLAATYRVFPLTPLLYTLILIHCIICCKSTRHGDECLQIVVATVVNVSHCEPA